MALGVGLRKAALAAFTLAMLNVGVLGRHLGRQLLDSQDTSVLNFAVSVGSGADAAIRKSYVAQDTINDALYSVAQVQQGTVALGGSSLAVVQAEGRPVQSIFVYRFKPGSISETKWAVNLQASAPGPQTFFLTAAAASPNSGDLFLVGTYSGVFTIGGFNMTSSGSFDIFVAAVSAADGRVMWANSFGGALGADMAFDMGFNPATGEVLVSGAFSKNAVFGPDHAAAASVNNVMQSEGIFVACLTANEGAVSWITSFPSDAEFMSTVKLAVSMDAVYVGAAAYGPFTVYANGSKLSIPSTGAGAVLVKLGFDGQLDTNSTPTTIMAVSNGVPAFTLSAMGASRDAVYVSCTYVGKLLAGGATVGQTEDVYGNTAVVQMNSLLVLPVWFTSLSGSGAQAVDSLVVVPGDSSVFISGNAWSADQVVVTAITPGTAVEEAAFQAPPGGAKGAFLMQLSGSSGAMLWLRTYEGYQDQASQLLYDAQGAGDPRVVVTGLFDRGRSCLALNSRDSQCATGERPFFLAAIPVSPTNTAAVEKELEEQNPAYGDTSSGSSDSSLSGGAIAGIVLGSVLAAAAIAAGGVFGYKWWQQRKEESQDDRHHEVQESGPSWASGTVATVTTSARLKK